MRLLAGQLSSWASWQQQPHGKQRAATRPWPLPRSVQPTSIIHQRALSCPPLSLILAPQVAVPMLQRSAIQALFEPATSSTQTHAPSLAGRRAALPRQQGRRAGQGHHHEEQQHQPALRAGCSAQARGERPVASKCIEPQQLLHAGEAR